MTTDIEKLTQDMIYQIQTATGQTITDPKPVTAISTAIVDYVDTKTFGGSGNYATYGDVDTVSQGASAYSYYLWCYHGNWLFLHR